MVFNMIALRTSLQDLTTINHKVERENEILQRKSETDPLTGLYNRNGLNDYWEKHLKRPITIKVRSRWKYWISIISKNITITMDIKQVIVVS